jgi:uncharacterized membrane protein HdeD (DUF308 family)
MMAAALVVAGGFRIVDGVQVAAARRVGMDRASAASSRFIAGLVIAAGWPVNSLWLLGLFLAIDLVMQGLALIAFGVLAKG